MANPSPDEGVRAAAEPLLRNLGAYAPLPDGAYLGVPIGMLRKLHAALSTPVPEEGLRGSASAAEQPALVSAQDDPVRRAAYQQAMSRLANRVGLSDRFTASMRPELHQYEGSVLVGSHEATDIGTKLTEAQRSLARLLVNGMSARCIFPEEAKRRGLASDFDRCRRAGLLQSAGYETSVQADDFLESPAGTALLRSLQESQT